MRIFGLGVYEILAILLVCLLVFGANKLPEIGRSLGKAIRELKKSVKEMEGEEPDKPSSTNTPSGA